MKVFEAPHDATVISLSAGSFKYMSVASTPAPVGQSGNGTMVDIWLSPTKEGEGSWWRQWRLGWEKQLTNKNQEEPT